MASRPKRGKFMPIEVHQSQYEEEGSDSEDGSSEESSDGENTPQPSTSGDITIKKEREEVSCSQSVQPAPSRKRASPRGQQKRGKRPSRNRQIESEEEDEDDEEDEDEADVPSAKRSRNVPFRPFDIDDDDFMPPPTPRVESPTVTIRDPKDVGRIYAKLFDTCRKLEYNTGDKNFEQTMKENIKQGRAVFEFLKAQKPDQQQNTFGGHNNMLMAFLHTKISSNIMRIRAERIGIGTTVFSFDTFLDSLKKEFVDEDGNYSHELIAANVAKETSIGVKTLMPLVAVVGTFDRDAPPVPPKFKKPRVPVRKTNTDEATVVPLPQSENSSNDMQLVQQNQNASTDLLAKEINKALKHVWQQSSEPINFYELILDPTSFSKTIENAFTVSFLIKDGHVSLSKDDNGRLKDFSLVLKPEKSKIHEVEPQKDMDSNRNQKLRHNFIVSINRNVQNLGSSSSGMSTIDELLKRFNTERNPDKGSQFADLPRRRGLPAIKYN